MFTKLLFAALLALASPVQALAEATIPTKDIAGAKDNPLIKRYDRGCTHPDRLPSSGGPLPSGSAEELPGRREGGRRRSALHLQRRRLRR